MAKHEPGLRNHDAAWSNFDADEYWEHNYATVLPEDAEIIEHASKFLITCGAAEGSRSAVDVGAGTNLYPALLMLPWAKEILFTEYAPANIRWLNENLVDTPGKWPWQPFWDLVAPLPGYQDIAHPRRRLAGMNEVRTLSIFDLPRRTWELGSMFFVADGLTEDQAEFEAAVRAFLGALVPGSPFLMAFMEGSTGYDVRGVKFPSVRVTQPSLEELLGRLPVTSTEIYRTDKSIRALRPGYDGMLLVTGWVAD